MKTLTRRSLIASGLGTALAGCTNPRLLDSPSTARTDKFTSLKPLDLRPENLIKITVCTRPLRPAGPRLEAERISGKSIVHNYGHGGSGWSLAWGYAEAARDLAAASRPSSVAVVGAGAIGLTTAIALAETGAKVTIVAREMPMETRSTRATGVWSPASRVALKSAASADFPERWEALTRRSHARHLTYVGRSGSPVEYTPRYYIRTETRETPLAVVPEEGDDFLHIGRRLRGLEPPWSERPEHPFPTEQGVRGGLVMTFNIAEYTRQLTEDFLAMGGRIERAEIASMDELVGLPGDAVVNCAGYGAKTLAKDASLIGVRGQIAWMAPQPDRLYGIYHRNVTALSRRDGLLIQETGGNDYFGLGDDSETVSQDEFAAALAKVAPMFDWG
ncbi:MAG: FAD-dependent oxidoreductase [Pseudomonadota bacterium]